ncbi:hypothetical protein E1B28_001384 [Marasmius oreades]|uniref:GP-PDE domain-containing protein n=1 Tax=Marasmius oreades TaxID=181124 RepID=A0A9P8AF43_9AGAR|nr:uncharacterized protein E1B28_001384 [Marasmius oreades]KAG7099551.1 hypothetical protein E1B28_001384 [Marasmius oreades]
MKSVSLTIPPRETAVMPDNSTSPWLGGVRLDAFEGSFGEQIAEAAHTISADILSPADMASREIDDSGYVPFTTKSMVDRAHAFNMLVVPWTVNRLDVAEEVLDAGVDGLITDYPGTMRRLVQQKGYRVAPKYPKKRVLNCLQKHLTLQRL